MFQPHLHTVSLARGYPHFKNVNTSDYLKVIPIHSVMLVIPLTQT